MSSAGLAKDTAAAAPTIENYGSKATGNDAAIVRARQLADAAGNPGGYLLRRVTALETINKSVQLLWKTHYDNYIALGLSEQSAKDRATQRVAAYNASELAVLDQEMPADFQRLALDLTFKTSTAKIVGIPSERRSRKK